MSSKNQPPAVILIRPQLGENIGAVARAMANFGARDLRLVNPRPFDAVAAARSACDGRDILTAAVTFPDLRSAAADCVLTVATTRRARRVKLESAHPAAAAARLTGLPPGGLGALVFGAEQAGLTNAELFLCDLTSSIPTAKSGSLNLSHAVLLYLYEWRQAALGAAPEAGTALLATHLHKQRIYDLLEKLLLASQYQPRSRLPEFMRRVKLLFEQRLMTEREQRILLKVLRHWEKLIPQRP